MIAIAPPMLDIQGLMIPCDFESWINFGQHVMGQPSPSFVEWQRSSLQWNYKSVWKATRNLKGLLTRDVNHIKNIWIIKDCEMIWCFSLICTRCICQSSMTSWSWIAIWICCSTKSRSRTTTLQGCNDHSYIASQSTTKSLRRITTQSLQGCNRHKI